MSKNILQNKGIELNTIGQIQTTKYGGICIFDLNGKLTGKGQVVISS